MNLSEVRIKRFGQGRRLHLLFALGLLAVITLVAFSSRYYLELLPKAVFIYFFILICVYAGRWLCKIWLFRQRWVFFLLAGAMIFWVLSMTGIFCWISLSNYQSETFFITIPLFTVLFILSGAGATLTKTVIRQQLDEARILQNQKESELNLLISQLSPHFLFNTLNNLYGMAIRGHEQVPEHIVKLSALLRYSVYLAKQRLIPLKDEVAYLKNYTDFEKIRYGNRLQLTMSLEDIHADLKVAPMLLIPFVENAFKHTKNAKGNPEQICIQLRTEADAIFLSVRNSQNKSSEKRGLENSGGMGLENVKKRLELLYPGNYDLVIESNEGYFIVKLKITALTNETI